MKGDEKNLTEREREKGRESTEDHSLEVLTWYLTNEHQWQGENNSGQSESHCLLSYLPKKEIPAHSRACILRGFEGENLVSYLIPLSSIPLLTTDYDHFQPTSWRDYDSERPISPRPSHFHRDPNDRTARPSFDNSDLVRYPRQ